MKLRVNSWTMAALSRRVPRAVLQTRPAELRGYASASGFKRKTGIRDGEGAPDVPGEQPTGRRRRDTVRPLSHKSITSLTIVLQAFLPMPTSQLTHPLFQPDHLSRLSLQPFHPVRMSLAYALLMSASLRTFSLLHPARKQLHLQSSLRHSSSLIMSRTPSGYLVFPVIY
jgi:hypothetical protein